MLSVLLAGIEDTNIGMKPMALQQPATATSGVLPAVPEDDIIALGTLESSQQGATSEIVPAETKGQSFSPEEAATAAALSRAHEGVQEDSFVPDPLGPPTPHLAPESRYLVEEPDQEGLSDFPAAANVFPMSSPTPTAQLPPAANFFPVSSSTPTALLPPASAQGNNAQAALLPSEMYAVPGAAHGVHVGALSPEGYAAEERQLFKDQTFALALVSVSLFGVTFRHEAAEALRNAASAVSEGGWVAGALLCFFLAVLPWIVKAIVGVRAAIRFAHKLEAKLEVSSHKG